MKAIHQKIIYTALIIAAAMIWPITASAHKVGVYAYVEDGQVKGQAYFAGGGKAVGSPVAISDGAGKDYGQATTNAEGEFSLKLPDGVTPPLKLTLKASQGHQASYEIPANELPGAAKQGGGSSDVPTAADDTKAVALGTMVGIMALTTVSAEETQNEATPAAAGISSAELERVVARVVGEKLAPLNAQVAKLAGEREITIHDIAAGIGYIIGLLGLAAWFKSRKA